MEMYTSSVKLRDKYLKSKFIEDFSAEKKITN